MDNDFSMKELYDCVIKTTYPIEINNHKIEAGEVIALFDRIQISNFQEIKSSAAATGGKLNTPLVFWDTTKEVDLIFSQGVFSKRQFAVMNNCKLISKSNQPLTIHQREYLEVDENLQITTKYIPYNNIFVYDQDYNKLSFTSNNNLITLQSINPYENVIVDYDYDYNKTSTTMVVGGQLINGFVSLEAKTRVKDDVGNIQTGIIRIPKMRIVSDFSIRLGEQANPHINTLKAIGYPTGSRGDAKAMEIILLDNDIDSDI